MASQQMPRRDPSKKVKEREDRYGKESFGEKERELVSDRAWPVNIVQDKEVEEGRRARESGGGKFETKGEENTGLGEKDKLEGRTRVVEGKVWNKDEKRRNNPPSGKVEAEKARPIKKTREKDETKEGDDEKQRRGREQNEEPSLEDISKYRAEAQQKSMNAIEAANEKYEKKREKQAEIEASKERNRNKQANEENLEEEEEKDVTVEIGKSASKMASDLRDRAIVTGWSAAEYSTEMSVEGTKAVTNIVEEAVEFLGQKAYEVAAKSLDTVTGLASATGENAKEYTARKKEEAKRVLEAKRETQNQESKGMPSEKATTRSIRKGQEHAIQKEEGKMEEQKPLDKASDGGFGTETIGESMVKPSQNVHEHQNQSEEGGVLNAIGETIAEMAETTRVMVAGEGEKEKPKSHEYEDADMKLD